MRASARSRAMTSRMPAASIPSGWNSFATMRMPTVKSSPTRSRTAREHLAREPRAALEVAAVAVGARVVEGREELVQQIAVRHVDLDAVEAALARDLGGSPPSPR